MKAAAMTKAQTTRYRWAVLLRVLAHALAAVGAMQRAPAVLLSTLVSFLLYTAVALWAFHVRNLLRVMAWMAGSAALLTAALQALKGLA